MLNWVIEHENEAAEHALETEASSERPAAGAVSENAEYATDHTESAVDDLDDVASFCFCNRCAGSCGPIEAMQEMNVWSRRGVTQWLTHSFYQLS